MQKDNYKLSRRDFLKLTSLSAGAIALGACSSQEKVQAHVKKEPGEMTLRLNHNTGDKVSVLGYGCMRFPKVDGPDSDFDIAAIDEMIDYSLEHGINYFDTSPVYCKGESERIMGETLSRHPRESYYIATKMSNFAPETHSREASIAMFENSLKQLRTDYIDYYLLHSIGNGGPEALNARYFDNGILEYLQDQKKAGRIRNLGFSFHGDIANFNRLLEMHDRGEAHWDFVQIQLNYINWEHAAQDDGITAEWLYNELANRDIPVVIMEPLLGGRLAEVPDAIATKMKERRPDESIASWAFRFAAQPKVLTVLSGMTYLEHVEDNVATYSPLEPIDDAEHDFLMSVAASIAENDTIDCTACNYCMPCPYGIDIPGIFMHYNKCVNDDTMPHDSRDPEYEKARRAYLVGYDRRVEKLRQADRCIRCGQCISACPQSINIPKELMRIDRYTEELKQRKS